MKFLKRLFCRHEYTCKIVYILSGKNLKVVCRKCGKVKEYVPIEKRNHNEEKEHALNKGWHVV